MNLVEIIKDQLTSEVTSNFGSLIGASDAQIKSALAAGIPALLSALSGMASTGGAEKLASTISEFNPASAGGYASELSQNPTEALSQGNELLDTLLSGSSLSGLGSVLSKFTGIDAGSLKKLLAYAAPFVMEAISKQFQGRPATAQGLKNLFAEQKANITQAMPTGLSLAGIPGLSELGSAANSAAATVRKTAEMVPKPDSSFMKMLLPICALALLAVFGWQYFQGRNEKAGVKGTGENEASTTVNKPTLNIPDPIPDVKIVSDGLTSVISKTTETLSDVTDLQTAETALPELNKLSSQLDGLAGLWKKIPAEARSTIIKFVTDHMDKLTELITKVEAIPGVGDKLSPVLKNIVDKLKSLDGDQ